MTMRIGYLILGLAALAVPLFRVAAADLETLDGKVYRNYEIRKVREDSLSIIHDGGFSTVRFEVLPEALRQEYIGSVEDLIDRLLANDWDVRCGKKIPAALFQGNAGSSPGETDSAAWLIRPLKRNVYFDRFLAVTSAVAPEVYGIAAFSLLPGRTEANATADLNYIRDYLQKAHGIALQPAAEWVYRAELGDRRELVVRADRQPPNGIRVSLFFWDRRYYVEAPDSRAFGIRFGEALPPETVVRMEEPNCYVIDPPEKLPDFQIYQARRTPVSQVVFQVTGQADFAGREAFERLEALKAQLETKYAAAPTAFKKKAKGSGYRFDLPHTEILLVALERPPERSCLVIICTDRRLEACNNREVADLDRRLRLVAPPGS